MLKAATIREKLNSFLGQTAVRDQWMGVDVWTWKKGDRATLLDSLGTTHIELHEIGPACRYCIPLALSLTPQSFPDFARLVRDWLDGKKDLTQKLAGYSI